jgi:hypothetical protein
MSIINIGAPDYDEFTKSVFDNSLQEAKKLALTSVDLSELRKQLKDFIAAVEGVEHSLDIIADSPTGEQWFGKSPVTLILDDPHSTFDDELVQLIKQRFSQCRLLGCVTAHDASDHARMLNLASLLAMPVIGTLRGIAYTDFSQKSFIDTQMVRGREMSIVYSTSRMAPVRNRISRRQGKIYASGSIQGAWLRGFPQILIRPTDLLPAEFNDPIYRVPASYFNSPFATTDVIRTAPAGFVSLHVRQGPSVRAEILASATLLRMRRPGYDPIYMNVPPQSPIRRDLSTMLAMRRSWTRTIGARA